MLILPFDSLKCGICDGLLESPMECNNCHNLFCEECLDEYLSTKEQYRRLYFCPLCRNKKNSFSKNVKINNMLEKYKNSEKKLCVKCQSVIEKEKYEEHINKCWFKCNICHKVFGNETKFTKHITKDKNHDLDIILNKFNRKANKLESKNENNNKIDDDYGKIKREKFQNNLNQNKDDKKEENDIMLVDRNGYNVKYDLYFCGKENGINCECCVNKTCSPNGEICPECMKKNLKFHELKRYYLINKEGRACKYIHGYFHCYSKFEKITEDKGGNYFKNEVTCCNNYTCEACKYITKIMKYYLSTHTIQKLIARDMELNKTEKNSYKY